MVLFAAMLSAATAWAEDVSIATVAEWNTFAGRVNGGETTLGGLLTADLDFDGETFTVAGTSAHPFCGTFDGAGHTVTGISVSKSGDVSANRQGIFGSIGSGGTVRNVTVTGSSFAGWDYVGGIAGYNQGGTIENCHVTATVTIGTTAMSKQYHGGIVGYNSSVYSTVSHCTSSATVTNNDYTSCHNFGGIVGSNSGGTVEHCLAVGATVSAVTNSGAVVGQNTSTLSYNYYGHCTVGEATSDIGTNTGDITTNDGAVPAIILYDHGTEASGNGTTIVDNTGSGKNVALYGRTLYKDGAWNTLCLPFAVSDFTGTALEGTTVMELDTDCDYSGHKTGFDSTTGTLYLYFKTAKAIEAGKPYIVKWATTGDNIENPVFSGVTVSSTTASTVEAKNSNLNTVQFIGTYSPFALTPNDQSNLFLGTSSNAQNETQSTLFYPNASNNDDGKYYVNACRAYFHVDFTGATNVRAFVLSFGEDEATGIREITAPTPDPSPAWEGSGCACYSLDGRRLSGKPTQRGVFIVTGKKIVIK